MEQKLGTSKSPDERQTTACTKLKKTLHYREEIAHVDAIRLCFDKDRQSYDDDLHVSLRNSLTERSASKSSFIRGYTKDGVAMVQNFAARDTEWNEDSYIKSNIYMFERALACTERQTNGERDKIVVFYDYNGYKLKNSPPPMLIKELMFKFRDHWPERLQHVFIVDSPFIFRAFWAIIKHFIDPITVSFVQFITGDEQKEILRELISEDQAAPYMFNGGKDEVEVDMAKFFDTPFDCAYGEEHN